MSWMLLPQRRGNSIVINSIQFMIDDTTPLQTQARSLAVKDAEAKAQTLAEASGVTLGEPITITESTYFEGPANPVCDCRSRL